MYIEPENPWNHHGLHHYGDAFMATIFTAKRRLEERGNAWARDRGLTREQFRWMGTCTTGTELVRWQFWIRDYETAFEFFLTFG